MHFLQALIVAAHVALPNVGSPVIAVDTPPPMWRLERIPIPPRYTPYTVAPRLINRDEVRNELMRWYPQAAKAQRTEASVLLWVYVDTTGYVREVRVRQSAGADFDRAATHVAGIMKFTPATNSDRPVAVWIQLPIVFRGDWPSKARPH